MEDEQDQEAKPEELEKEDFDSGCPVCGEPLSDRDRCNHIVVSADDDTTVSKCVSFADADEIWDALREFLERFVEPYAEVVRESYDANYPGRSGTWTYVCTRDPAALKAEMRSNLEAELAGVRRRKLEAQGKAKRKRPGRKPNPRGSPGSGRLGTSAADSR